MSKLSSIKGRLLLVCNLVKQINSEGPFKTNSAIAKEAIVNLDLIVKELTELIVPKYCENLKYHISKGGGMFPSIPWIAITLENTKPSKDKSIAICFDKSGLGFVVGVLLPTGIDSNYSPVFRGSLPKLNVDGFSDFTKYNNRFINPQEFLMDEFSENEFTKHLLISIELFGNTFVNQPNKKLDVAIN
jgi:hypothetical protein